MKVVFIIMLLVLACCINENLVDARCPFSSSRCVLHCRDNGFGSGKCKWFKCRCLKKKK